MSACARLQGEWAPGAPEPLNCLVCCCAHDCIKLLQQRIVYEQTICEIIVLTKHCIVIKIATAHLIWIVIATSRAEILNLYIYYSGLF